MTTTSANKIISLAIIEKFPLLRQGLASVVDKIKGVRVIDCLPELKKIHYSKLRKPSIVLLTLTPRQSQVLGLIREFQEKFTKTKLLIFIKEFDLALIQKLYDMRLSMMLASCSNELDLTVAIKSLHRSSIYIQQDILRALTSSNSENGEVLSMTVEFTNRELDVLRAICLQKKNNEIASELSISVRTVEVHRQKLLQKTKSKNVVGLLLYSIRQGVIN
ncbi:MAG: response regulator transcription factor [Cryomorphaceae bacterium]|nr:response regulator transcription factor [Cryomorphaceae bacterium]